MKILITVHTYVPNTDGVEFVTKYLAEGLVKKGHEVTIITYFYPDRCNVKEETINGVKVIRWNAYTQHTFHKGDKTGYQSYILKHQNEFDVMVNVGTQTALTDWLLPIYEKITIPRFLYIHSIWDFKIYDAEKRNIKKLLAKLWANLRWSIYFNKYTKAFKSYGMVSQLHEQDYSYNYFLKKYSIKSKIIENAAEERFFSAESSVNLKKFQDPYAIYVANYNPGKDQKRCLRLFYECDIPDNCKMIFIGSSSTHYYQSLLEYNRTLMQEKGIDESKAEFLINVPRDQIADYVSGAELFIMTSQREAFPISIVESIATGVPFVSTDVGIVKYIPGGIVEADDANLKKSIETLLNDNQLRNEYGKQGRDYALLHFQQEDKIKQLESYLIELVEGK